MSNPPDFSFVVKETDVFMLTARGDNQVREAGTQLSPQELSLLVHLDGRASVGQVAMRMKTSSEVLAPVITQFIRNGLIDLSRTAAGDALDFDMMFSTGSFASPSALAMDEAEREVAAGTSSLKRNGYYTRIARSAVTERKLAKGEKLTAIVVEDEPYLAKFLAQYLALENFIPRIASNRVEIVTEFRKLPIPDLVLLDVTLPDVDGFNVLLKIRQHPALAKVPVIMLTAHATREAVLKGLAGGADGYVTKPVEVETLIGVVKTVLGIAPG